MAKDDKEKTEGQAAVRQPTPNRDAYKASFNEDYPDIDFEDKETRYGKMNEDRARYKEYVKAGRALSDTFTKNRWLAAMLYDLRQNPDKDPITWMADNGIDILEALENDEYRKTIADKVADYQKKQAEGEKAAEEHDANLQASAEALKAIQQERGMTDEETGALWADVWQNIIDPALRGQITGDTWTMLINARNYDNDMATAQEQGAVKGRNEKINNKLRKYDNSTPPTLTQGAGQSAANKPKRKVSSFWEDLI